MLYRSSLPLISAHVFCACRVCVKCAQTQISGLKNFIFQSLYPFSKLFCGRVVVGVALFNPILTGYKSTPRLSIEKRARAYCLPVVRARAAPTRCTKAVQRAVSVLPCQSVRACAALTLCRLSGHPVHALPPVRAPRPRPAACQGIPSAPTWDKMLLCGKICHKNGNLGNEKNQKPS